MNWLYFIAATLACFRLTRLITDDKITDFLRRLVRREARKHRAPKLKYGIECPFCVSFYYSTFITLGLWWAGSFDWPWIFFWQPAIWGGSIFWNQLFVRISNEK